MILPTVLLEITFWTQFAHGIGQKHWSTPDPARFAENAVAMKKTKVLKSNTAKNISTLSVTCDGDGPRPKAFAEQRC